MAILHKLGKHVLNSLKHVLVLFLFINFKYFTCESYIFIRKISKVNK